MRKIKIVADSSADLIALESADFDFAPMKVLTADREFTDDTNLDVAEMVSFLAKYKGKSKSSCPNVHDWLRAFGDADEVYCITITSGLSGSYNSACLAKKEYEANNPGKRVFVLDTLSAGPEMTLAVFKLEELVRSGLLFDEICERIAEYSKNTALIFMLKSLKNFANNGRVSPIIAKIVGIAGICIVGKASDEGTLETTHKCRGEAKSLITLVNDMEAHGFKHGKVSIGHCQNPEGAERLRELITERFGEVEIEIHAFMGLCSFYAEKGGILVGFEKF
ncbi:MAG: DegV family protein [Clostridia bacterium]|nr:DegV family protein [Clostridia bacterium]